MAVDSFEATEQTMRTPGGALDDRLLEEEYLKADDGRRREIAQFIMGLHGTKGERFITADTLYNWILDDAKARAAKGK